MAWNQTTALGGGSKQDWVKKEDYDIAIQKYLFSQEQNMNYREKIDKLEIMINAKFNPIEKLGYKFSWESGSDECYIGQDKQYKILICKDISQAYFRYNNVGSSERGASVEEMKACVAYLEGMV